MARALSWSPNDKVPVVFASPKAKKEEKESPLQFCKRDPPLFRRPQVKQAAKNIDEKKKISMPGK